MFIYENKWHPNKYVKVNSTHTKNNLIYNMHIQR